MIERKILIENDYLLIKIGFDLTEISWFEVLTMLRLESMLRNTYNTLADNGINL